jgi:HEAT repeat protein
MRNNISCFLFLLFAILASSLGAAEDNHKNHLLFLMRSGHITQAVEAYKNYHQQKGPHDFELIQELGLLLLDQGYHSTDPEIRVMTTFGAGISLNERTLYILEAGMDSGIPELQLICLNYLSQFQNDKADEALQRAMNASHPLIRLEAAFIMAQKKAPRAFAYAESLMYRFEDLTFLFPQFFAIIGNAEATRMLRKLMSHSDEEVRVAAILSAAKYGRDDLLPKIRTLATQNEKAQQEACAFALGTLKDETSQKRLELLSRSKVLHVRLAAWKALYDLGRKEFKAPIEKAAKEKDIFAIALLGDIEGSQNVLSDLVNDNNIQVKINAAVALLHLQDSRCLSALIDILIMDSRGLCFSKTQSKGNSLSAWKAVPSGKQNFKDEPYAFEVSLSMREDLLEEAIDLPENNFLQLAKVIFLRQQNDLVPLTVELLEMLHTKGAINLLKEHQQQIGAPLIRNYCNLALYNLKEEGPYGDNIRTWISNMQNEDLIRFRPFLPRELREHEEHYQLTPQDNSSLLIASFESFVGNKDERGIDILLDAIQNGNSKNKFALAGLLLRATH